MGGYTPHVDERWRMEMEKRGIPRIGLACVSKTNPLENWGNLVFLGKEVLGILLS